VKLPDFRSDVRLNDLRTRMGAPLTQKFRTESTGKSIDPAELAALGNEGLDVSVDQIRVERDGTLSFRDVRVVVYIRDTSAV